MQILVIRFSSLGDVVLSVGALRTIARALPDAHLTFVTKPMYQHLAQHLDIPLHLPALDSDRPLWSARQALKGTRFDCIVDLHGSIRSMTLSRLLRSHRRLHVRNFRARRQAMVKHKSGLDRPLSVLQMYGDAIRPLGITDGDLHPRLFLSGDEARQANTLRDSAQSCLGIGWGARWPAKAVPPRLWESLLRDLGDGVPKSVRIFGMDHDRASIESFIQEHDCGWGGFHAECGHTIPDVMTRLAACDVFIGADSGLMHVAAALGVPTIGLFGPTHPALGFAPVGEQATHFHAGTWCSPCHRHGAAECFRGRRHCFDELDIAAIANAIRKVMARPWRLANVSAVQ